MYLKLRITKNPNPVNPSDYDFKNMIPINHTSALIRYRLIPLSRNTKSFFFILLNCLIFSKIV